MSTKVGDGVDLLTVKPPLKPGDDTATKVESGFRVLSDLAVEEPGNKAALEICLRKRGIQNGGR